MAHYSRRAFPMAHDTKAHALQLKRGLERLGPDFIAELCICDGFGERRQTYTHGCGFGSYRMMGVCEWCNGTGLTQAGKVPPESIVNQVLVAGE